MAVDVPQRLDTPVPHVTPVATPARPKWLTRTPSHRPGAKKPCSKRNLRSSWSWLASLSQSFDRWRSPSVSSTA
eukprot:9738185-Alexandrium_andersonii.AAC.1